MTQGGSCSLVSELHHPQSSPKALATGSTSVELVFLEDSLLSVVLAPATWAARGSRASWKCRLSGPSPDAQSQKRHFNESPGDSCAFAV